MWFCSYQSILGHDEQKLFYWIVESEKGLTKKSEWQKVMSAAENFGKVNSNFLDAKKNFIHQSFSNLCFFGLRLCLSKFLFCSFCVQRKITIKSSNLNKNKKVYKLPSLWKFLIRTSLNLNIWFITKTQIFSSKSVEHQHHLEKIKRIEKQIKSNFMMLVKTNIERA